MVKEYIKVKYGKPGKVFLGVIHRLDRPTSGIVAFARTSKALARMNAIFSEKEAEKVYWAVVKKQPEPESGTLIHWMVRNQKQNKSYAHDSKRPGAKKAVLHYSCLRKLDRYFLLEIVLQTGRHHQIRAQLAAMGNPIKGDLKYGSDRSNPNGSIHLHARKLSFVHPVKKEMIRCLAAPPEEELWNACL